VVNWDSVAKEDPMTQETPEEWGSEEPLYNIGAVVRMIGVPEATLRVWERRYEFPQPARTPGGHRLYSESQVRRLQWVKAQIDDGVRTGQAIRSLQHLEQEGRIPQAPWSPQVAIREAEADTSLKAFQEHLTETLLAHDVERADQILGEALALYSLEDLMLDVVRPTLADIGQAWCDGHATVATEHFTTNYLRHRLLAWMLTGPKPHRVRPVVLACAPGEWHEGSLLILGALMRRRRWPMAYLGQSVPLPDLVAFVEEMKPPAVVFVAMTEEPASALIEWPHSFPQSAQGGQPVITFGGLIFTEQPEWRDKVPGTFLGSTLREGAERLDRLLRNLTPRAF
jgi:DNA-binding transcriptional MerR regulator